MAEYAAHNWVAVNAAVTRQRNEAAQANLTRRALVEVTYTSIGVGQHRLAKPIDFPVTFVEEPHFVCGCGTAKQIDPKKWCDPVGQTGIWAWKRDKAGYFIGAYIWLKVSIDRIAQVKKTASGSGVSVQNFSSSLANYNDARAYAEVNSSLQTLHFLTFTGTAKKDVATPDVNSLKPRTVNL